MRSRIGWVGFAVGLAVLGGSAGGCVRGSLPEICPDIAEGELVISELRRNNSQSDDFEHYIEVYNASGRALDLYGLEVRLESRRGDAYEFFVREDVELGAGEYLVIVPGEHGNAARWIETATALNFYPIGWDISGGDPEENEPPKQIFKTVYSEGFVEVAVCDVLVDEVYYEQGELPSEGTRACGNADSPPDAATNDDVSAGCWCDDQLPNDQGLQGSGLPGSPGQANRCP